MSQILNYQLKNASNPVVYRILCRQEEEIGTDKRIPGNYSMNIIENKQQKKCRKCGYVGKWCEDYMQISTLGIPWHTRNEVLKIIQASLKK